MRKTGKLGGGGGWTASEVFLIFTAQLYSCLCNYNGTVFLLNFENLPRLKYSHFLPSIDISTEYWFYD